MQFRRFIFLISKLPCPSKISFPSYRATCVKVQRGALAYSRLLCSGSPHAAELPQLQADGPASNVSFPCHLPLINWIIVSVHYNFLGHFPHGSIFAFGGTLSTRTYKPIYPGSWSFLMIISAEKIFLPLERTQCTSSAPWACSAETSQTLGALPRTRAHSYKRQVVPKQYIPALTDVNALRPALSHTYRGSQET